MLAIFFRYFSSPFSRRFSATHFPASSLEIVYPIAVDSRPVFGSSTPTRISLFVSPLTKRLQRTIVKFSPLSARLSYMILLSLWGTLSITSYNGNVTKGKSRPKRDMPVVLQTTIQGLPVAPPCRS